jgi:aspartate aminotransferase
MTSQGLASGDVNRDAQPLRFMIHEGVPVVLVQSFDTVSIMQLSSSIANNADDGNLHR